MTRPLTLAPGAGWAPSIKVGVAAGLAVWFAVAWALGVNGVLAVDASQTLRPVLLPIVIPVAVFLGAYQPVEKGAIDRVSLDGDRDEGGFAIPRR